MSTTAEPAPAEREIVINHAGSASQLAFWASAAQVRAYVGGVGSGKTRAGAVEVLRQPAGSRGIVVAPTYNMLHDSTLDGFLQVARPLIRRARGLGTRGPTETTLVTGTEILWRSADDPDSLRGPNLGWGWADEAAMMPEATLDILLGRLRAEPGRLWITTTPRGFNWVWRVFCKDRRAGYELIRSATGDNPFLRPDFVESLESKYTGAWARQELRGEFVEWVDVPCYPAFVRELHTETGLHATYRPDVPLALCCDFNVRCMYWPVVQVVRCEPRVLRVISMEGIATVEGMVRRFRDEYPAHVAGLSIYGDASGSSRTAQTGRSDYDLIEAEFRGYPSRIEMRVPSANPAPRDRIAAVNRLLRGGDGRARLLMDADTCEPLITDFLRVEWDKLGTAEHQVSDPDDDRHKLTHCSSALGYMIIREWPVSSENINQRPRPAAPIVTATVLGAI